MSIKRRWLELQRFFRHWSSLLSIFATCFLLFVFTLAYNLNQSQEIARDRMKYGREVNANRRVNAEKELRRKNKNEKERVDDSDDLPGDPDPDTIFKLGEIGNFEPKETQWQPGNYGEMGEPVLVDKTLPEVKEAMREYGFNTYVSDMISLNRSIPDVRMDECKYWHYPEDLPTASVVIAFHNEGWTPLLRTVHSVLLRSPPELIKEIIMVDDFSDKEHLKGRLDIYLKQFNGKVKLIRNAEREGLIRTRSIGAKKAIGDVIIFLDAHCEVNINWLPPLLAPIRRNRKVMTVPVIDGIDKDDWSYRIVYSSVDRHYRGIFEWGLLYKETEISTQELIRRKYNSEPFRSPTHAGGLFAINRKWFEELGYYDPGLQIWGGEQYELSFKIWQCGGGILFVPCSHVGHVYRSHMPYNFGKLSGKPVISTNMLRVIKTWMDEYDKYYYIREPSAKHRLPGDISSQLELRKNLKCKSFRWYMEKVAYDVIVSYPLPPENHVWGEAKNHATGKCIDTMGRAIPAIVGAVPCHGYGGSQLIRLNKKGQLTQGEWCITPANGNLIAKHCVKGTVDGPFAYDEGFHWMEALFVESLNIFDCKWIFIIVIVIALRFYFKGAQFRERKTAKGLVAVVTGCNCGIGKEIVRELNLRGAKVYMLCRSEDRAQNAIIQLVKLGCNPHRLLVKVVDLARFKSVKAAAAEIIEEEDHLDILINNAGIMLYPKFKLTDDGHELVWQTNYLGHFLLTELLLPLLRAAPTARIVNVSALAHFYADPIDLQLIDRREGWDSRQSYSKSKLAMVMHAFELTRRLRACEGSHVTINVCHPGLCNTRLMRYTPLAQKPLNYLTAPFRWYLLKTPKDGAQTPLFLALSKTVTGSSGLYYSECVPKAFIEMADWEKKCAKLYDYALHATGLV